MALTTTVSVCLASQNHGIRCVRTLKSRRLVCEELTREEVRGLGHAMGT